MQLERTQWHTYKNLISVQKIQFFREFIKYEIVLTNGTNSYVERRAGGASAVGPFEGAEARERPRIVVVVRGRHVVLAVVVARRTAGQGAAAVDQHPHVDAEDDRDAADVHVQ